MEPVALLVEAARNLRHGGPTVFLELFVRTLFSLRSVHGTAAFGRDWDLLVVLDACRADLLAEVAPEYDWLSADEPVTSVGATSTEWLRNTFGPAPDDVLADTVYVTGNPFSDGHVDGERLLAVEEVWRDAWDDAVGTVPARPVTDRAIAAAREHDPGRLVVHYMQPHFPCVPGPDDADGVALDAFGEEPVSVWEELRFGLRSEAEVWERYRENLRYVLDDVALLLENVDAERAVITADHGNAVGEWWLYGHVEGVSLPCLREVPWSVTTATDEGTHEPAPGTAAEEPPDEAGPTDEETAAVERRLSDLGYL